MICVGAGFPGAGQVDGHFQGANLDLDAGVGVQGDHVDGEHREREHRERGDCDHLDRGLDVSGDLGYCLVGRWVMGRSPLVVEATTECNEAGIASTILNVTGIAGLVAVAATVFVQFQKPSRPRRFGPRPYMTAAESLAIPPVVLRSIAPSPLAQITNRRHQTKDRSTLFALIAVQAQMASSRSRLICM